MAIGAFMCCCAARGGASTPNRRVKAKLREDRRDATQPNETWAMDFVHDQLPTGRKIRVLTVVDTSRAMRR